VTELSYLTPGVRGFKDRSAMLQVVGIFFILGGLLCGCLAASVPAATMLPRPPSAPQQRPVDLVAALVLYAALAGGLITLGVGTIHKRRWVRPLVLIFAWLGLVGGTISTVMWTVMMPDFISAMQANLRAGAGPKPPAMVFTAIAVGATVFYVVLGIIIPSLLIWLFKKNDVQATLEFYDATPRWTDGVPLPVLALSVLLALVGLWSLMPLVQGWFFAFGAILTGWPARVPLAVIAALSLFAAWKAYRRERIGWRIAIALFAIVPLGWIVTMLRIDIPTLYAAMGRSAQEVEIARSMRFLSPATMAISVGVMTIAAIAFTLRTRRYFDAPPPPPDLPRPPV
jgi:hypothetical protein